ncbi:MAG: extracellular solute-binding protein [Candidatus Paceibacterota bacterium]
MTNATQIIILGIFIFFLIIAVIVFAAFGTSTSNPETVQVEIWGTMPASVFSNITNDVNAIKPGTLNLFYKEIAPEVFESTLINALADGEGPDAVLLPSELLAKQQRKLALISFEAYTERDFKDNFIEGSEILLTPRGTYGLPFLTDPIVMYWNRDMLNSAAVASAPTSWEQVIALTEKLTVRREDRTIEKSTVSFGDYSNVDHAKDILATLMLQSGSRIVTRNSEGAVTNVMNDNGNYVSNPVLTALDFYTQFADPLKPVYTWNRSLPSSKQAFLNGDLAFYFGPVSELREIQSKNPNLNFDVATIPQPQNATVKKTGGTIYSFSVLAASENQQAALYTISTLTSPEVATMASNALSLPPARRGLLSVTPGTGTGEVFWRSALWTTTWLDPDPVQSDAAFQSAIDSVVTGREKVEQTSRSLSAKIDEIIRNSISK